MKRILALLLSCCLLLACVSAMAEESASNGTQLVAEANDGLIFLSGSAYTTTEDYSSYLTAYVYAEVRNDSAAGMEIDGSLEALDADGNVLDTSYVSVMPGYVAPGEIAYVTGSFIIAKTDEIVNPEDLATVKLTVGVDPISFGRKCSVVKNATVEMANGTNFLGMSQEVFRVTITNDSDSDLYNPQVIAGAFDAEGKLLYYSSETFILSAGIHLPSGSTLMLDLTPPLGVAQLCAQNNVQVAEIRCLVYTEE